MRALSGLQVGVESEPSNAALIDMPLPASWFRIPAPMDPIEATASIAAPRLYYYANIKTKQTSWERPEKDPYFVDDAVYGRFTRREHSFLRGLFDEEIANCGNVSIDGCRDMLLEAGERMTRKQLALLFKAYTGDVRELRMYPHFINICLYAKIHNHRMSLSFWQALRARFRRLFAASLRSLFCCAVVPSSGLTIMSNRRERLGQWTLEYSELADRSFYRHSVTQATSWEMPDEVRFYVEPTKLFPKVSSSVALQSTAI